MSTIAHPPRKSREARTIRDAAAQVILARVHVAATSVADLIGMARSRGITPTTVRQIIDDLAAADVVTIQAGSDIIIAPGRRPR